MKKIAVITGASSGMGRRFAETVREWGSFDEVWAIARRADRLEELKATVPFPVRPVALDLTDRSSFAAYAALLKEEEVEVGLLVNASGFGKFAAAMDTPLEVNLNMVDLNCQALMALCQLTVPYMTEGSRIINVASLTSQLGLKNMRYAESTAVSLFLTVINFALVMLTNAVSKRVNDYGIW